MSSTTHSFEASTSAILLGQTTAQQNSKYKAYASAVDKALKSFENTTEWADLIAALGKLGKVFSSHAKTFNDIPNSLTVSKRLSQCLHPALPSGVHIKALETYRQVFLILGRTQNLARFLFLYAAGLFPLMDHCGIKVKSELLAIIEQFLIPLGPDLRAALPGLITALLLALEEGTEFYGRAFALLDQLVEKVGTDAFYICFWQAVSGNPSARLPALIFVNAKIEKRKNSSGDLLASICGGGQASDHMLRALCAVAEDTGTPLIQRHLLDFLCTTIPINSEWVPRQDLVQLLRRCLFVVLRRDMSLNRRLYQWLLNRTNDMAFTGLPVNGVEDSLDMAFFKKNTLPLIKAAIRDYLSTVVIEVPPPSTGAILPVRSTTSTLTKNYSQLQFPEVRVCRLLHYMLDRPELGQLVLEECLPDLLNTACTRDATLMKELQRECEEIDPSFCHLWNCADLELSEQEQARRIDEIRKNFNALLNSLEPSFLWTFFERLFAEINKLEYADRDSVDFSLQECEEENSLNEQEDEQYKKKQLRNVFPLMILYCIKNVQLDSSEGDIRNRHMPMLLRHILTGIDVVQNAAFALDNLVAIVVVCRHLLTEITQNNVSVVFESFHEAAAATNSAETSPSKKNVKCNKELTEEQKLVELSLEACLTLLSSICQWYTESREREKIGLLAAVSTLVWDFADFPFYSLQPLAALSASDPQSPSDSVNNLKWLHSLTSLIDPNSWRTNDDYYDFDIRAKLFDLLLYLCVRSGSMIEQHAAVFGRALSQQRTSSSSNEKDNNKKTTTTVLLKPFLSQANLNQIENSELFQKSSSVLWERFSENTELPRLHTVALLLLRLHSRRITDSSSEVEDIIVGELTSANKALSGEAARKFRDLWVFCRSSQIEEVYGGIPLKPMNRVVMVLLGFIADDSFGTEQVELRALAHSWFQDCARNNDLHKILQMLTLMLLNPTTARVSIQFVQMRQRITPEQLPSLPEAANCVSLTTFTGKQTFHHVCKDVDGQKQRSEAANIFAAPPKQSGNSWSDYSYINCSPKQSWVSELNRQLLLPSNATTSSCYQQQIEGVTKPEDSATADQTMSCQKKSQHNRTLSDIPQFDNDVESMDSFSLDASLDQDVLDVMQLLVDTVCEQYELREENEDEIPEENKTITKLEQSNKAEDDHPNSDEVFKKENKSHVRNRYISSAQEADEISVVGSLITPAATSAALPRISAYSGSGGDTIKRIRTGHRRQDSLQESIFSTGTQELRLFDPAELPNSTCPGDYKQPLLDETFSHMLFYAESPGMVDLGRAEKLFRTIDTLLKGGLGRQIVSCMLFTNMSTMTAGTGFGRPNDGRSSICGGAAAAVSQQLMEFMARHYRHIQGEGFWDKAAQNDGNAEGNDMNEGKTQQPQRNSTLFEIFSTLILYFFRSYYLNSPTNYVSEADLALAWKCKIAALDCFTELLRILDGIVRDASSKEFATFVQHIYRQTKTQKVVLTLMLAAVPTPAQKGWKMPLTMDIAEFNNGSQKSSHFRDLIYAYHRALLNLASSLVILEYSLLIGIRYFSSHNSQGVVPPNFGQTHQITENQINYNSSQTRSTIREARYSVVELRLFLGVILNALKRCPERHELWLEFLIGILPYLDRALATFVVHVTEQICRNLYVCVFNNNNANAELLSSPLSAVQAMAASFLEHPKSPMQFVDYRFMPPNSKNNSEDISPVDSPRITIKYPANYMLNLIESLMSILHFSMLDNNLSFLVSPQMVAKNTATAFTPYAGQITSGPTTTTSPNRHSMLSTHSSTSGAGGGTFSSSNMTSVVGSAISVIPGTGLINNLFGRVFTSGDSSNSTNVARSENVGKTPEWLDAQRELIKRLPGVLAILSDVWSYIGGKDTIEFTKSPTTFGTYKALTSLILEIVNSIAKKHKNMIISAFGIVWIFRSSAPHSDHPSAKGNDQSQCNFIYSPQQVSIAKFALHLKALSLNSIIVSISETLKEISNKAKVGVNDKAYNYSLEVSLLDFLHECTRQLSVAELKESWNALNILFNETPLAQLPARAAFIEFTILVDFVRRCGTQAILEDRYIGKAILDVCQKLVEAVNSIVGWQLESTTWLKRTLVVRQDAASQKTMSDLSPVLDQKGIAASSMTMSSTSALPSSEANSIRGSTISLSGIPPSRLSSALDIHPSNSTSVMDSRKQMASSSLRSSIKDSSAGGRKDPSDSTQAIFLFAENLTELIDSVTKSEEKEKMLPLIQAVWNNTLPYLKSKSAKNVRSFLASSQLLASMSSFNYMRTVWKKNAMELLWDNSFFKMDMHALRQWLIVIDNLMTNDKTSFKELLARITTSTSTTLSTLITSKEQEYEMRAQYLKRLAFVILSSELDQYSGQLNEIQERLTENLRLCQAPVIHTQVFACYRVLLVRMSPSSFVSIWPSMVTELVQVLAQIEQHLCNITNNTSLDEQRSAKDEQFMQLFLAGCKLLETLCILPSGYVSQFQMCRWTFVAPMNARTMSELFVPFAVKLDQLLSTKYGPLTNEDLELRTVSLFNVKTLTSLQELQPLFHVLAQQNRHLMVGTNDGQSQHLHNGQMSPPPTDNGSPRHDNDSNKFYTEEPLDGSLPLKKAVARVEHSLYVDFAEHWQL